jgi:hypothetical protein
MQEHERRPLAALEDGRRHTVEVELSRVDGKARQQAFVKFCHDALLSSKML